MRIATWNLQHGGGPTRTPEQALLVRQLAPDVLVLCEYRLARGDQLSCMLADQGLTHRLLAPGGDAHTNRVAVFSRVPMSSHPWDGPPTPRLLACCIGADASGLRLLALHVPDESSPARDRHWHDVVRWARGHGDGRAMLAGDFNTSRRGPDLPRAGQTCEHLMGMLETLGYRDCFRQLAHAPDASGPSVVAMPASWIGPRGERSRIDAIWRSRALGQSLKNCWYHGTCASTAASDHVACVADLDVHCVALPSENAVKTSLFDA